MIETLIGTTEALPLPDVVTRRGINFFVGRTDRQLAQAGTGSEARFAAGMASYPVAEHTDAANAQHYEIPAAFFAEVLGPRRKYSCCLYSTPETTLAEAEDAALSDTCAHADLHDGQDVLELGCGWGSLSLWMASAYPNSRIVAVSNSQSQRAFIENQAAERGLTNLAVGHGRHECVRAGTTIRPDRIGRNVRAHGELVGAVRAHARLATPDGLLFLHVFTHADAPYRFDRTDKTNWIAQHFFTGGIMPSRRLIRQFERSFTLEQEWYWNGVHYARTARDWLQRFDSRLGHLRPILHGVYGRNARLWERRWRLFFLATEGLFGFGGGKRWGVSHYRLRRGS